MTGIHEHPHADRLRAARQIGASPDAATSAPVAVLAIVVGVLAAVVMVVVMVGMLAARLVMAPGFWLGVVVVAVLTHLAGMWP